MQLANQVIHAPPILNVHRVFALEAVAGGVASMNNNHDGFTS